MKAIDAQQITKRYGSFYALKGVSLEIPHGGVHCILGPNGAGKTTLSRILTTMTKASSGHIKIYGYDVQKDVLPIRALTGMVAQDNHFDTYLSLIDNLKLHAAMHGLGQSHTRCMTLLEKTGLADKAYQTIETLSGGMKRRLVLARALIHHPKLLFLDEPTTGLDPQVRRELWETIESLRQETTIILTTHYMDEAERLADTITMMQHGEILSHSSAQALKTHWSAANTLLFKFKKPLPEAVLPQLEAHPLVTHVTQIESKTLKVSLLDEDAFNPIWLILSPHAIEAFQPFQPPLEEVFLAITGSTVKEARLA
jgi:ABC-2 type transport system ATP-binding protein